MYIPQSHEGGKWHTVFPQKLFAKEGVYPNVGEVERVISTAPKICTGRAGTIIFCDTTGLHKGGYSTHKERIMFTALYKYNLRHTPPQFVYSSNFKEASQDFTPLQRFILTP